MGIVSSSLTTGALRVVWVCQMLLDPKYSSVEDKENESPSSESSTPVNQQKLDKTQQQQEHQNTETESTAVAASDSSSVKIVAKSPAFSALSNKKSSENNNSLHQQNRNRRAQQLRFKTRPSSFDAALIVRGKSKNSLIVTSSSSPLRRQNVRNVRVWKVSSSSGCSSDSCSNSETDSETELRVSENVSNEEDSTRLGMSAEEEAAFRLTVGRGHFSRSKKDRFLNHLRLEKRLNDISYDCFGMPCGSHHRHPLQRRHSGDLHRII